MPFEPRLNYSIEGFWAEPMIKLSLCPSLPPPSLAEGDHAKHPTAHRKFKHRWRSPKSLSSHGVICFRFEAHNSPNPSYPFLQWGFKHYLWATYCLKTTLLSYQLIQSIFSTKYLGLIYWNPFDCCFTAFDYQVFSELIFFIHLGSHHKPSSQQLFQLFSPLRQALHSYQTGTEYDY